ncbi:DNA helicase-2 / ATP-dependent DNA helicase PcrA [Caldanaerobius fijiensis DSM 17918]|uniref:ATP-dependent DNA helicase n=1 Tax=Caldanaerobius fijiensis DSM 17918 TaxID=1121256 RepID=A0A1M5CIA6_9THEO|nr:DNA helicase PcrA [Caldanaerobius fijiensis]SHF54494.1 DNA helicase-2 / ATP-dependent DNA helicase PcrA [Caldanaerobius fijiensis DSM 17918]
MDLIDSLNEAQRNAVLATEGPLLILAGAGSGKTRVITHRIAYLIKEKGVSPYNILAITFTNKAAREMRERVEALLGGEARDIWIMTFHAACVRILRRDIEHIGYSRSFVIYDASDQLTLLKNCIKELDLNEKLYDPKAMLSAISKAKDKMIGPDEYAKAYGEDFRNKKIGDIYRLYQDKLKKNNALDFDDIILKTIELFKSNPEVLDYYQRRFKYIMVDEYQDTNAAQYQLIKLLSSYHQNLCVVGDDDQSIYGWRGADIRNILDFEKDFKNTKVIKLEQNYRSTKQILEAANEVVANNKGRKAKKLWTANDDGTPITVYTAADEHDEAEYAIMRILEGVAQGKSFGDYAILYRTNAQSRVFEDVLNREGIPYKMVGGLRFYDRKEIKDIIAYLRVLQNPLDDISLRRIVNVPRRGIGEGTLSKLDESAAKRGISLYDAMMECDDILPGRTARTIGKFVEMMSELMAVKEVATVTQLINEVLDRTGYIKELEKDDSEENQSRIQNLQEFLTVAQEFENKSEDKSLQAFLENISLVTDVDNLDENEDAVILMTLHGAKGLEFDNVFLVGMEEGVFPLSRAMLDEAQLEEERRLCYVGITRARKKLYITHALQRNIYGSVNYNPVSRFVEEIPEHLIEHEGYEAGGVSRSERKYIAATAEPRRTGTLFTQDQGDFGVPLTHRHKRDRSAVKFTEGQKVQHAKWGIGTVVEASDSEVVVVFDSVGSKRLAVDFAPLKVIE